MVIIGIMVVEIIVPTVTIVLLGVHQSQLRAETGAAALCAVFANSNAGAKSYPKRLSQSRPVLKNRRVHSCLLGNGSLQQPLKFCVIIVVNMPYDPFPSSQLSTHYILYCNVIVSIFFSIIPV